MKLYTYFRSSSAYRVRIALALKGIAYESVPVHLVTGEQRAAEYLARNPQGLVPTLEDGPVTIGQSLAILEYLEETHPDPPLLPPDPAGRARVRQIAHAIAGDIQPLQNLRVLNRLTGEFGLSQQDRDRWVKGVIESGLAAVEGLLAPDPGTGLCCHGDTPTLADVCLVPQVFNALRFGCDLAGCPAVTRIHTHCDALPAFRAADPENQPDAQ